MGWERRYVVVRIHGKRERRICTKKNAKIYMTSGRFLLPRPIASDPRIAKFGMVKGKPD